MKQNLILILILSVVAAGVGILILTSHKMPLTVQQKDLIKDRPVIPGKDSDSIIFGDSWMEADLSYGSKIVMRWKVDTKHFGEINYINDSLGAVKALIEYIRQSSKRFDQIDDMNDTLRSQLITMHNTGKCPLGEQWHNQVHTKEFTTVAGCYTKKEFASMLDTTDTPRIEISAVTVTRKK